MSAPLTAGQLVRYPKDPNKIHTYRVSTAKFMPGQVFLYPVKQDGSARTLAQTARYSKWVATEDLLPCQPQP